MYGEFNLVSGIHGVTIPTSTKVFLPSYF